MPNLKLTNLFIITSVILCFAAFASADDLIINDPPASGTYDSDGTITAQNNCVIYDNVNVIFDSTYEITLKPNFHAQPGSQFDARIKDNDGLPNAWEMSYFGHLNYGPNDDPDGDGLTNLMELQLGTDPTQFDADTDNDGLPDSWEMTHFGHLNYGKNDDPDGDGFSNYLEYLGGSNPTDLNSTPKPGAYYEYDMLGRVKSIVRIK